MEKESIITRDGRRYEVLQAGLEYNAKKPKACIFPKGEKRAIAIAKALEQGFIRDLGPTDPSAIGRADPQLDLTYVDRMQGKDANKKLHVNESGPRIETRKSSAVRVFHLPVSQLRAQLFLAHGLIYPANCDDGPSATMQDAQARVPHSLVLWQQQPPVSSNEIVFGLRLTEDEIADAEKQNDRIYISTPLPISRLVEIAVPAASTEDVKTYMRGWIEPDVPVPAELFTPVAKVVPESVTSQTEIAPNSHSPSAPNDDWRVAMIKFNQILGMFAYMRNAARYHSSRSGLYADYPTQCFRLASELFEILDVSQIPSVPASQCLLALIDEGVAASGVQAQLRALITTPGAYIDRKKASPIAADILESAHGSAELKKAFALLFDDDYKAAIPLLQKEATPEEAVLLATLYKFSDRQSNDYRNIKQSLHEDWLNLPRMATALGVLGAYYGYTALDARESRLYALDRRVAEKVDPRPDIKFHLKNRFERELIEAIYQHAFYNKKLDSRTSTLFDGLQDKTQPRPAAPQPIYWKDDSYQVGDLWVRAYRLTPLARCLQRIEALPCKNLDETSVLGQYLMHACFFHAEDFEISRKQGKEALRYRISKQRLLELLSDEKIRVNTKIVLAALDEDVAPRK
jgi:hypothetical protein